MLSEEEQRKALLVDQLLDFAVLDHARADQLLDEDPWLLEHPTPLGGTPLHFLAVEGYIEGVKYLLARGANPDPRDHHGSSPLLDCVTIAKRVDRAAIIEILLEAGADPYFWNETRGCAWHEARSSDLPALHRMFSKLPPPAEPHETCEFDLRIGVLGPPRF
jgi:ankyrin repeat protein